MDYVTLGRSGLKISRACLGAMNFGTAGGFGIDDAQARPIIDAYLDSWHNFIDTAGNYNDGQSEEIVGRAVRSRRDAVVIATKGFMPQGPGPNDRGLSRVHLTRALDASLRRLGTDYIDLYQCHYADPDTPIEETMATLDGFLRAGKVRYLGCSNFTASQIVEAQWAAQRLGVTPLISLQPQYSLIAPPSRLTYSGAPPGARRGSTDRKLPGRSATDRSRRATRAPRGEVVGACVANQLGSGMRRSTWR